MYRSYSACLPRSWQITYRLDPLRASVSLSADGILTTTAVANEYRSLTITVVATEENPNCILTIDGEPLGHGWMLMQ